MKTIPKSMSYMLAIFCVAMAIIHVGVAIAICPDGVWWRIAWTMAIVLFIAAAIINFVAARRRN